MFYRGVKLKSGIPELIYRKFLGGSSKDVIYDLTLDANNNVYLTEKSGQVPLGCG